MDVKERFLAHLFERTDGRSDRTLHAYLHIAKPLRLSLTETQACVHALVHDGLIEADAMFDSLIWLTPKGIAACRRCFIADAIVADSPSATEPLGSLVAPYSAPAQLTIQPMHG